MFFEFYGLWRPPDLPAEGLMSHIVIVLFRQAGQTMLRLLEPHLLCVAIIVTCVSPVKEWRWLSGPWSPTISQPDRVNIPCWNVESVPLVCCIQMHTEYSTYTYDYFYFAHLVSLFSRGPAYMGSIFTTGFSYMTVCLYLCNSLGL